MGQRRRNKQKQQAEPPAFDESALNKSIAQLERQLTKPNGAANKTNQVPNHTANGDKRKRKDDPAQDAGEAPRPKKHQKNASAPFLNGERQKKVSRGKLDSAALLDEIKALGGDEADLELVAEIDSDGQEEGDEFLELGDEAQIDHSLQNELAKFASSLGFQNMPEMDDTGTEEERDQDAEIEEQEFPSESEEDQGAQAPKAEPRLGKHAGNLKFEPRPDWHVVAVNKFPSPTSDDVNKSSSAIVALKTHAQSLIEDDALAYTKYQGSSSNRRFMSTIISSGTLSDKVSALTLAIQESPVHNIKAFESLITLSGKKSRGQAIGALGALVDLLGNGTVLPSDRRLRTFESQPGLIGSLQKNSTRTWESGHKLPGKVSPADLIMWIYEDWLKNAYFRVIQLLEVWCGDEIEFSRSRALDFVFGLLKEKPEQEANLLRLLVNKLGDRERKIASRASYLLLQLLNIHPAMKAIVVRTVEHEVLLRPGQTIRPKYFAVNTLNQTILSSKEPDIADALLRIYFDMFLGLLRTGSLGAVDSFEGGEKKQVDTRRTKSRRRQKKPAVDTPNNDQEMAQKLVSAVLTGVNRAIPFAMADESTLETHLDTLFRITHSSNFNTSVQALMLIQQLAASKHLAVERFYRTLYESLLDPRLTTSSKQALYLNLLFRSLKNDLNVRRVKAFVKRMLQVLHLHQSSFACGILFLVSELETTFPDLKTLLNTPEDHEEDEEEVYKDVIDTESVNVEQSTNGVGVADRSKQQTYDGRKRDPEYSNADKSCLWELVPVLTHFHPSVALFAANLLVRQKSLPKPELANHTLMHFLDRFVYRNPKATDTKRGSSIMQPVLAAGGDRSGAASVVVPGRVGARQQPVVNSAAFWNLKPEQVAAEDVFFHEYFAQVGKPGRQAKKAEKAEGESEGGSEDEEVAEDEIWEALVKSRSDIEGGEEGDSDLDMADLDDDSDISLDLSSDEEGVDGDDVDEEAMLSDMSGEDDGGFEGIFGDSDEEAESDDDGGAILAKGERRGASKFSRKEMKGLPTFASAEDYAEMLAAEDDLDD